MSEWWEGFFEGLWQEAQLALWSEDDNRAAADTIERAIGLQHSARVLDVPCGDERISLELADRGHDVTGVDLTERFLAQAGRKAEERGLLVQWERRDMRNLSFESEFEAALNFGGSFGYFDEPRNARVATGVYRALRPGGRFLIDIPSPETVFPRFRDRFWHAARDVLVLSENRYDHETSRIEADWTVAAPDGRRESLHSSIRLYTYRELAGLLRDAGFASFEGFDVEDLEPFGLGASRLMLVATKEG